MNICFDVISENPVFSFKIPGPARVLLPILPTLSISYLDLNPLKRKNICANCVKTLSQISRIRENISKALNVTESANSQPTTPVESGKGLPKHHPRS